MPDSRPAVIYHCCLLLWLLAASLAFSPAAQAQPADTQRAQQLMADAEKRLAALFSAGRLSLGRPVFIRIFKIPGSLELWLQGDDGFELLQTYPLCSYSGYPGPKLQEGDWQSPEGFYTVTKEQLNPNSKYHLSFNIGFPNAFDTARLRTGSQIMVHGGCRSMGCYAMGDRAIEEIYLLVHSALAGGQGKVNVHVFPFRLTAGNLKKYRYSPWRQFWRMLEPGYTYFENTGQVPEITTQKGQYVVNGNRLNVAMSDFSNKVNQ